MKFHMLMFMNAWMMLMLMKCRCQMQCLTLGCYSNFLPRFTWLPPSYVPVVSTAHLVDHRLIGITRLATHWAPQEPTLKVMVAQ